MALQLGHPSTSAMLSNHSTLRLTNSWVSVTIFCLLTACAAEDTGQSSRRDMLTTMQDEFWAALQELCGRAFPGQLIEASPPDEILAGQVLIMHVRECEDDSVRIPFHVGNDRSRTWVNSRTEEGLHLKHEHNHEDGSEEEITQYGGDTSTSGSRSRQDFPADSHTASLVSTAANNIWGIEIRAGRTFVYSLRNGTTNHRVRLEFNLAEPIEELPPPPWGA